MADDHEGAGRRRGWSAGPEAPAPETGAEDWLTLTDDELLFRIEALPADHHADARLIVVVRSSRHFFVRQEAAKKIRDHRRLRAHSGDRHIGQILVRAMNRREDAAYLESLVRESRHIEVKKAAEAQLVLLMDKGEER